MDKTTFRTRALKRLRSVPRGRARMMDHRIRSHLTERFRRERVRTVMLYVPLSGEVDMLPLIGWLRRRGVRVLVPFMEGESFRLVQYRLPLRRRRYGVREPDFSNRYTKEPIDIAIVPIVGTDTSCRRIGFGKGMYDRFFAREGGRIGRTIFVQRCLQWYSGLLTDDWDIRADEMIAATLRASC